MIITTPRPFERLLANLAEVDAKSVFLVGCGQCATQVMTGGKKEVLEAAEAFEAAGITVTGFVIDEVTCHLAGVKVALRKAGESVESADAIIVYTCGAGVQSVAESTGKPVFPALDSSFLGNVVRHGIFEERCQTCGDCVLDKTAGICPVTQCPKGLLNGPCGGMWDGRCEVKGERACIHVVIAEKLIAQGRHQGESLAPKNYGVKLKPGRVDLRSQSRKKEVE